MITCPLCGKIQQRGNGTFFSVPKEEDKRKKWSDVCGTNIKAKGRVCLEHFLPSAYIKPGRNPMLMPFATPTIQLSDQAPIPEKCNLPGKSCICGCLKPNSLYKFPNKVYDGDRRNLWLDYFGIQDPDLENIYACERHFSPSQSIGEGIRLDAIPDIPCILRLPSIIQQTKVKKHKKKKTSSKLETNQINSNVITATTTNEAPEESLVYENELQVVLGENLEQNSVLEIPIQKPESKESFTQTNTRLCGSVQVSEFADEYRLNCYFCCETFPLEKWKLFITHLNQKHYAYEAAFHIPKYVSDDHDYTAIDKPRFSSIDINLKITQKETLIIEPKMFPYVFETQDSSNSLFDAVILNPLYSGAEENISVLKTREIDKQNSLLKNDRITSPPPLLLPKAKDFKIKVKRKNSVSKSNGNKLKSKVPSSGIFYIINSKRQSCNKTTLNRCLKRTITDSIDTDSINNTVLEPVPKPMDIEVFQQNSTELTYEYTPKDIIDLLLDTMKNYSVLWQFDSLPFNQDYYEAIEELCKIINETWSLNIDNLKMRRSVNRLLRFYLSVYPLQDIENINQFTSYYDKCAEFLPKSVHQIAYARCSHCYMCFTCDFDLKSHLLKEQSQLQWPYKCLECKECFSDSDEFEFHKILPHYQEVFRCEKCPKTFTRRNLYNHHVANHLFKESKEPGQHKCSQCDKAFKYKTTLALHILYHGERKFKCHLCPKSYHVNGKLKSHLKIHRKEYNFMCEICSKGFLVQSTLDRHMDTHTQVKVVCNICNLRLRQSSLKRHLRMVHVVSLGTNESIQKRQQFHYRRLLSRNEGRLTKKLALKKETISYQCKVCNIDFESQKLKMKHNKEFHGDRTKWSCKLCSSLYSFKHTLRRHYRLKHNLYRYQIYKLIDLNESSESVLTVKHEDIETLAETSASYRPTVKCSKSNIKMEESIHIPVDEVERMPADTIQDEIMKAADHINEQEIKIDNDHYMNDFFENLLK